MKLGVPGMCHVIPCMRIATCSTKMPNMHFINYYTHDQNLVRRDVKMDFFEVSHLDVKRGVDWVTPV